MNVQIINKSKHPLPAYATELSAGMDLFHILKLFSASFSASISQLYRFLKKIAPTPQIPIRTG